MKFHYPDCYKKWKEEKKNKAETIDEEVLEKLESVLSGVGELSKLLKLRKKS